ncbi:MAG TPA: TlpA disulfide reductase family protein [Gemmatimonadaceae bacterium]|jgi:thiol-disulfide isomerase/thioredoxin|nr:TlpA disulfide reductase family protein [Gemmatimonadaceae bacterium]
MIYLLAVALLTATIPPAESVSLKTSSAARGAVVPLSADLLDRYIAVKQALKAFWPEHAALMESARAHGLNPTVRVTGPDGTPEEKRIGVFDYVALTAQDSALAAVFTKCHFLPNQFASTQVSVYQALYTLMASSAGATLGAADTAGVAGQNLALVRAARRSLTSAGVSVSVPRTVGRPAAVLDAQQWLNMPKGSAPPKFGDGQIYVVNFTAHWCGPCHMIYPVLSKFATTYAKRGVHVVYATQLYGYFGETQDLAPDAEVDSLKHYITEHGFVGPVALLPDVAGSGYGPETGGFSYPLVAVIDGHGILREAFEGWSDDFPASLSAAVDRVLAGTQANVR